MSTSPLSIDMSKAQPITPPSGAPVLDMSKAEPISAAQPSGGGMGGLISRAENWAENVDAAATPVDRIAARVIGGGAKMASSGLGGMVDFYHWLTGPTKEQFNIEHMAQNPEASQQDRDQAWEQEQQARDHSHLAKAADWLREGTEPQGVAEHIGAIGEQALEYISGEKLFGMAGGLARAGEAAEGVTRAAVSTNRLKNAQQLAETLAKNPKAAGYLAIGIRAVQNAVGVGAQTMLHTEDPEQAAHAAELGGGLGLAMEPLAGAGRYLMRNAPQYVERLGQRFPVMASQLNAAGKIVQGNVATAAPGLHEAQQAALPGAMQNLAQRAVTKAIGLINAGRPVYKAITDEGRLLPAPEGSEGFTFTRGTTPTTETPQGELILPSRKKNLGTVYESRENPQGFTPQEELPKYGITNLEGLPNPAEPQYAPGREPAGAGETNARNIRKVQRQQALTSVKPGSPEARSETVGGGGIQTTKDPRQAIQWLTDLDRLQESDAFENMPEAEQQRVKDEAKALNDQLGIFYSSPYAQRFGPEDLPGMLDKVRDFGDAQAQLEHAAKPVYAVMDKASNGDFSKWNNQFKLAQKVLRRPSSIEAAETAEARMNEANEKILGIFDKYRSDSRVSLDDYMAAKNTWKQSARLGELDSRISQMMNGVTLEESETGMQRMMTRGDVRGLENYLRKDTNREQIEGLIGKDGVANLKEMVGMFTSARNNRAMQKVGRNVSDYLMRKGWLGKGLAMTAGGTAAHVLGLPPSVGTLAGYSSVEGLRTVLRYAAVNPRVGNMLTWAAEHGVDPRIYTPLIARAIREPFDEQKRQNQEPQAEAGK